MPRLAEDKGDKVPVRCPYCLGPAYYSGKVFSDPSEWGKGFCADSVNCRGTFSLQITYTLTGRGR